MIKRILEPEVMDSEADALEYNRHQQKLFRDSLQAALTLEEFKDSVAHLGLDDVKVYQSSELHWTIERVFD